MAYLIIPIFMFVLIGGITWLVLAPVAKRQLRGSLDDLDTILSILMTAGRDEPRLLMKVPRRVTSLSMIIAGSVVRLEMPLVTRLQRSRKERYLAMLRDLGLDARIPDTGGGHEILEWSIEGSPAETSALIKKIFIRLFEVGPGTTLEYRAHALVLDLNAIDQGLQEGPPDDKKELPSAPSRDLPPEATDQGRAGCLKMLVGFLLLPVPFMIAHLQFGFVAAAIVLVAILVAREVRRRWKQPKLGLVWADAVKIVALLLTGATIHAGDPVYLQLVPTAALLIAAATELAALSFNRPCLFVPNAEELSHSKTARMLLSFAIIATCLGSAAMNEYLRTNITLDAWMWIFAFVRIELFFGFLISAIPFLYYMVKRMPEMEGDAASR